MVITQRTHREINPGEDAVVGLKRRAWLFLCQTSLAMTLLMGLAPAFAQSGVQRDPADEIMRQKQLLERQNILREQREGIDLKDNTLQGGQDERAVQDIAETGPMFKIDTIELHGDIILSRKTFASIVRPFEGQMLGTERINVLLVRLNHAMVSAGYITSRAFVSKQELGDRHLNITVVAGRIEQLLYEGKPLTDPAMAGVRLALPMRQGDILRLPDIEQALDQLNRLRRNNAKVQIRPGVQSGGSIVEFDNKSGDSTRVTLTADNQGSQSTGRARVQASLEVGNLLGLMDTVSGGLITSTDTNALFGTISVPWGYSTVSGMASWSEYQNLVGDVALVYGASHTYTLSWAQLLARDQSSKTAINASLTQRKSSRYINDVLLTPQTQTVVRVGVNKLKRFELKHGVGQWVVDVGVSRGLPWLGGQHDGPDLSAQSARNQFTKLDATVTLELPATVHHLWRTTLATQWSNHPLFSSDQIFAGGVSSIRGFAESLWGADRGGYWRNEWVYRQQNAAASKWAFEPYVFLDGARLYTLSDDTWRGLLSTGGGLRVAYGRGTSGEIILGKPIRSSSSIPGTKSWRINASATYWF